MKYLVIVFLVALALFAMPVFASGNGPYANAAAASNSDSNAAAISNPTQQTRVNTDVGSASDSDSIAVSNPYFDFSGNGDPVARGLPIPTDFAYPGALYFSPGVPASVRLAQTERSFQKTCPAVEGLKLAESSRNEKIWADIGPVEVTWIPSLGYLLNSLSSKTVNGYVNQPNRVAYYVPYLCLGTVKVQVTDDEFTGFGLRPATRIAARFLRHNTTGFGRVLMPVEDSSFAFQRIVHSQGEAASFGAGLAGYIGEALTGINANVGRSDTTSTKSANAVAIFPVYARVNPAKVCPEYCDAVVIFGPPKKTKKNEKKEKKGQVITHKIVIELRQ